MSGDWVPATREELQAAYPADDPTPLYIRLAAMHIVLRNTDTHTLGWDSLQLLAEQLFELATSRA